MQLLKITPKKSMYFKLSDGRVGITYTSGYVRVSTKGGYSNQPRKLYQINKKIVLKYGKNNDQYQYKRELINNSDDRVKMLFEFNQNNCI